MSVDTFVAAHGLTASEAVLTIKNFRNAYYLTRTWNCFVSLFSDRAEVKVVMAKY
jgi:hypothetical protein